MVLTLPQPLPRDSVTQWRLGADELVDSAGRPCVGADGTHLAVLRRDWRLVSGSSGRGHRYYEREQLVRLQQILLLRELGLDLATIGGVVDAEHDPTEAVRRHTTNSRTS
jgi:hypothetical protein